MIRVCILDVAKAEGKTVILLIDFQNSKILPVFIGDWEGESIKRGAKKTSKEVMADFLGKYVKSLLSDV